MSERDSSAPERVSRLKMMRILQIVRLSLGQLELSEGLIALGQVVAEVNLVIVDRVSWRRIEGRKDRILLRKSLGRVDKGDCGILRSTLIEWDT